MSETVTQAGSIITPLGLKNSVRGIEEQGLDWKSSFGTGKGGDTITGGPEVIRIATPTKWSNNFLRSLFGYEWELTKSPAGAHQWKPKFLLTSSLRISTVIRNDIVFETQLLQLTFSFLEMQMGKAHLRVDPIWLIRAARRQKRMWSALSTHRTLRILNFSQR